MTPEQWADKLDYDEGPLHCSIANIIQEAITEERIKIINRIEEYKERESKGIMWTHTLTDICEDIKDLIAGGN